MKQCCRVVVALTTAVLVLALATAGLTRSAGAKRASGAPIKLGNVELFPRGSGGLPTPAQAVLAYVDDWNKRGGLNGQPIDYIQAYPAGVDPGSYVAALDKLVNEDKVIALPGFGNCAYTINNLRQYQIPSWGATTDPDCGLDDDFMFAGGITAGPTLPPFVFSVEKGATVFAVIRPDIGAVKQLWEIPIERYLEHHPELKVRLVDIAVPFVPTAADLDAAILKMKEEGADAVFAGAPDAALAIAEAKLQGMGPDDGVTWFFGPNIYTPQAATVAELEGIYVSNQAYPWEDTKNPEVKKMIKVLKGKVDVNDGFAQYGYQQGGFLENSLKGLKGKVTSESILQHWKKAKKVRWPLSPMYFDVTDGTKSPAGGVMLQVQDGAWVPVSDFIVIPAKEFAE